LVVPPCASFSVNAVYGGFAVPVKGPWAAPELNPIAVFAVPPNAPPVPELAVPNKPPVDPAVVVVGPKVGFEPPKSPPPPPPPPLAAAVFPPPNALEALLVAPNPNPEPPDVVLLALLPPKRPPVVGWVVPPNGLAAPKGDAATFVAPKPIGVPGMLDLDLSIASQVHQLYDITA
jgi:hypothetical protein